MYITVNGRNLYYEVKGTGTPLIMIHGNGETHEIFDEAIEVLSRHFTCYAFDSIGHGNSDPVDEYHYYDMAEDIACATIQLHLENAVYYGFSDGGIIGLLLAVNHPALYSRLIISGANTNPDGVRTWVKILFTILTKIRRNPLFELMLKEPHITAEQLQSISVPVTVIAGEKDLIKEEDTRFIADHIPHSHLIILPKEGHETYIVHQTKIADLIIQECKDIIQ